jgi:hypothetical protein
MTAYLTSDPLYSELLAYGVTPDAAAAACERAAIYQYDAGRPKASAEWMAKREAAKAMRYRSQDDSRS